MDQNGLKQELSGHRKADLNLHLSIIWTCIAKKYKKWEEDASMDTEIRVATIGLELFLTGKICGLI